MDNERQEMYRKQSFIEYTFDKGGNKIVKGELQIDEDLLFEKEEN
jgi:hypothetical protein